MNAPRPYLLFGMTCLGLLCQVFVPTKVKATEISRSSILAFTQVNPNSQNQPTIAQASQVGSPDRGSVLPWAIAGGVAILGVGSAVGVYTMGRRAGKQEANVHNAMDSYKQLVDLESARPSLLEEELQQMKSAQPVGTVATVTNNAMATNLDANEFFGTSAVQTQPRPVQTATVTAMSTQDSPPLSIDEVFGASHLATDLPERRSQPEVVPGATIAQPSRVPTTSVQATAIQPPATVIQPQTTAMESPRASLQVAPTASVPVSTVAASPYQVATLVPTASAQANGSVSAQASGQVVPANVSIEGEFVASNQSALAKPQSGGLVTEPRLPQMGAIEALMQDLRHPDIEKRRKAVWDLGQRGDTRAVQPLVDLMLDADSKQRSLILSALSEIGTRTLKPMGRALAISLQDENPEVRKNAIRDLTRVYDLIAQISQMVHRATEDPDAEVRDTANWALKQLNRIRPAAMDNAGTIANSVSRPESLPN